MKELAIVIGLYIAVGLIASAVLAFRKSKNPDAVKAIELMGSDPSFAISFLLWPVWIFMQIVEQDTVSPKLEKLEEKEKDDLGKLIGRIGRTVTPMVPSGRIKLGEKDYEAISDEGKMDRDEEVEVLAFSMGTLKVRKFQPDVAHNFGGSAPSIVRT
ncbi:NfeD family protein [Pelagicoccus mobilis]|uniref:NfeD family protein n=1 Tax=Pelagicoccus mobilis TaxID=415221 RepID=A0A934VUC9_9BACT|nr:NfeD family protein [Pelagicoccus mobilis]MBK1880613.1 NfeD family protein [Pelagicoccus mobilis]